MKIGIIVALDGEFEQMKKLLGGRSEGVVAGNEVVLHRSGIGKVNAALEAQSFINEYPLDCMVSTGVAGGLSGELAAMDVIAASEVVYHDVWCGEGNAYGQVQGFPERFAADAGLYACALASGAKGGLLASGDFFVSGSEQADAILGHFPEALAVDMESGAIAQTCHKHGVPFLSLRIISDTAGENHQGEYDDFWKSISEGSFDSVRNFLLNLPERI